MGLYLKFSLSGAGAGILVAVLALLPLHLTDPYYHNSNTAKEVFWFAIAPLFIALSTICCSIIGLITAWNINRRKK